MFQETKLKQSYHPATGGGGSLILVVARPELLPGSSPFLGPLKVEFLFLPVTAVTAFGTQTGENKPFLYIQEVLGPPATS
jgi:hypothetical protein